MQCRADALRERAGRDYGDGMVIKRKWLRWRTFNPTMDRINDLEYEADCAFVGRVATMFGFELPG